MLRVFQLGAIGDACLWLLPERAIRGSLYEFGRICLFSIDGVLHFTFWGSLADLALLSWLDLDSHGLKLVVLRKWLHSQHAHVGLFLLGQFLTGLVGCFDQSLYFYLGLWGGKGVAHLETGVACLQSLALAEGIRYLFEVSNNVLTLNLFIVVVKRTLGMHLGHRITLLCLILRMFDLLLAFSLRLTAFLRWFLKRFTFRFAIRVVAGRRAISIAIRKLQVRFTLSRYLFLCNGSISYRVHA